SVLLGGQCALRAHSVRRLFTLAPYFVCATPLCTFTYATEGRVRRQSRGFAPWYPQDQFHSKHNSWCFPEMQKRVQNSNFEPIGFPLAPYSGPAPQRSRTTAPTRSTQ